MESNKQELLIYVNGRILALSMRLDNCMSYERALELKSELKFYKIARSILEKKIKKEKKSGL